MAIDFDFPRELRSDLNFLANLPLIRFNTLDAVRRGHMTSALKFIVDTIEAGAGSNYFRFPVKSHESLAALSTSELQLLRVLIHMRCPWIRVGLCFGDDAGKTHTITVQFA